MSDVQLIQRHAGERTQQVGFALAQDDFSFVSSEAVSNGPFPQTLRMALEVASASSANWTIMLDADVLILPGSVARLIDLADRYPADHFVISASIYDNFLGTVRPGGIRAYRTAFIERAIKELGYGNQIRPESSLLKRLGELGHPSHATCLVAGVHDFEQSFADIYRTAVVHGVKFRTRIPREMPRWEERAEFDDDFRVLIEGVRHGLTLTDVELDATQFRELGSRILEELGLSEKPQLSATDALDANRYLPDDLQWLRRSTPLTRAFPEFASKMARRPGQPRRLRSPRLIFRHRKLLRRPSAIPFRRLI